LADAGATGDVVGGLFFLFAEDETLKAVDEFTCGAVETSGRERGNAAKNILIAGVADEI